MGTKKAITSAQKARKELTVSAPDGEAQTSTGSPEPSPRQDPTQPKPLQLPRTRRQPGRYRPRPG
jgi:hypothetical protein